MMLDWYDCYNLSFFLETIFASDVSTLVRERIFLVGRYYAGPKLYYFGLLALKGPP